MVARLAALARDAEPETGGACWLAQVLDRAEDEERENMADDNARAVRVPEVLLDRLDALRPLLRATPLGAAVRLSDAALVRLALEKGCEALEAELQPKPETKEEVRARRLAKATKGEDL
jgi:hypothetical protein